MKKFGEEYFRSCGRLLPIRVLFKIKDVEAKQKGDMILIENRGVRQTLVFRSGQNISRRFSRYDP